MKKALVLISLFFFLFSCKPQIKPDIKPDDKDDQGTEEPVTSGYVQVTPSPREWNGVKNGDVSYQLLVYSFADSDGDGWGDFNGIADKLNYLDDLGITAIWLSPIHPANSYHGYDVLDYDGIDPRYGTETDFKNLVDKAHSRGIKIYLDYVINHTSIEHPWFRQAVSSETSPYRDYYILSKDPKKDIAEGKISMMASEGAAAYDPNQWFSASSTVENTYLFKLDWSDSSAPTVTVSHCNETDAPNPDESAKDARYLYLGDGNCPKFYDKGAGIYELKIKYSSSWGFLIRTVNTSEWPLGTKYGGKHGNNTIEYDVPFRLYTSNSSNDDIADILMPDALMYHSHLWTSWFADLNYGAVDTAENSPAFKAITANAKAWIESGIDGFRLDAVKHIYHNEHSSENPDFLKKFYDCINRYFKEKHGKNFYMVGEVFSEAADAAQYYKGLPALFEFSFWWRLQYVLNEQKAAFFVKDILSYRDLYGQYRKDFIETTKLSNHDENRTCTELKGSLAKAKQAGAMLLTAGGDPYIYYGEELAYTGTKDGGDEYVRQPMLWGDSYETSYTDKIDKTLINKTGTVISQTNDENSILNVYRDFIKARNTYPALYNGVMMAHPVYNESSADKYPAISVWYMSDGNEKLLVMHNTGTADTELDLEDNVGNAAAVLGKVFIRDNADDKKQLKLSANSSVIFELK